jgi:hypothetical protein
MLPQFDRSTRSSVKIECDEKDEMWIEVSRELYDGAIALSPRIPIPTPFCMSAYLFAIFQHVWYDNALNRR